MFADFLRRLTAPAPEPLSDPDARLALAALLVRIAKTDGQYAASEIIRIDQILAQRYGLSRDDAISLRTSAERLEEEAPDTVRFTRAIKDAVPHEDRAGVIAALWQIALADGTRDQDEDALLRMVAPLLGISDQESNTIRRSIVTP